jgi:hypothetical protein
MKRERKVRWNFWKIAKPNQRVVSFVTYHWMLDKSWKATEEFVCFEEPTTQYVWNRKSKFHCFETDHHTISDAPKTIITLAYLWIRFVDIVTLFSDFFGVFIHIFIYYSISASVYMNKTLNSNFYGKCRKFFRLIFVSSSDWNMMSECRYLPVSMSHCHNFCLLVFSLHFFFFVTSRHFQ